MADAFTPEFKRLKARNPPPDLSNVIDLTTTLARGETLKKYNGKVSRINPPGPQGKFPVVGLKPCDSWEAFSFQDFPGFYLVLNPFIDGYQKYWVVRCLRDLPRDPDNVTNLTALGGKKGADLWAEFAQKNSSVLTKQDPLRKLRWTTLGYHYNWTTKEYSEANKAAFPEDVSCLSQYLAHCLGFESHCPEAAIVNYYHLDSTLAAHTDHSEIDHNAPLLSISFGQSAIFMLGGTDKSKVPMSVMLRSGDVCVMSGTSRLCYHAVPKILPPTPKELSPNCFKQLLKEEHDGIASKYSVTTKDISDSHKNESYNLYNTIIKQVNKNIERTLETMNFDSFEVYLSSSRINLNIRQVLPTGLQKLPENSNDVSCAEACSTESPENGENKEHHTETVNASLSYAVKEQSGASVCCNKNDHFDSKIRFQSKGNNELKNEGCPDDIKRLKTEHS